MRLGEFGVWTTYHAIGEENPGEAAKLLEDLGFGTLWLGGSPRLPALRPPLEATDRLVLATGILNVWASEPERVASDFAELETRFPGRVLLGIGIGHPEATSHYRKLIREASQLILMEPDYFCAAAGKQRPKVRRHDRRHHFASARAPGPAHPNETEPHEIRTGPAVLA